MVKKSLLKIYVLSQALLLVLAPVFLYNFAPKVAAAQLTSRSIVLSSSTPLQSVTHLFYFSFPGASLIGSIQFEYCSNSPLENTPCTVPSGLDLTSATLSDQSGEVGFLLTTSSTNKVIISRIPAITTPQAAGYAFSNVINPDNSQSTYYVRITTYATNNATGLNTDYGGLAFSVSGQLGTVTYVPPYLIFCVAVSVAGDCSSLSASLVDIGELSKTSPNTATTQFALATNGPTGYVVYALGTTMTAGNAVIPALTTPQPSVAGTGQFGLNLVNNSSPSFGTNPTGIGTGVPQTGYNTPNNFKFVNGDVIAYSPVSSDFTRFTQSYIVNVPNGQAPGFYGTTLTYLAMSSF